MASRRTHEERVLADVSDTARWVAYLRALESERHDALFHDVLARRLAGERGRAIAETPPMGPLPWSLAIRTRVFDDLILEAVREHQVDAVVNLGAGLDARPYRLALPANLRWFELDLPALVAGKDRELGFFPKGLWLLENAAPAALARQRRMWSSALRAADAEHKFAPREGLAFFRSRGWVPRSTRSLLDEAQRLRRELPVVALVRRVSPWLPFIERAYARRHEKLRDAMLYAIMEAATSPS